MSDTAYSTEIANIVKHFLNEDDWHFSFDEARGIFNFGLKLKGTLQKIDYVIDVKDDDVIVYGICPIGADRNDSRIMSQVAEFICRANYGLSNGSFEFDFRDGEIRFKSYIDCDGVIPSTKVIKNSLYCTAAMFKRYSSGFTSIIFAGGNAKEAIDICEKPLDEELVTFLNEEGIADGNADLSDMISQLTESLEIDGSNSDTVSSMHTEKDSC